MLEDVIFLREILRRDVGIESHLLHSHGWRLKINVLDTLKLMELVAPYTPPSMQYKLPMEYQDRFDENLYPVGEAFTCWDFPVVSEFKSEHQRSHVYCIDVEDTHNFVTVNGVVHNCLPTTPGAPRLKEHDRKTYLAYLRKMNAARKKQAKLEKKEYVPLPSPWDCCVTRLHGELWRAEATARARGDPNGVVIVPVGNFALKSVTGHEGIMKWRGSPIPIDLEHGKSFDLRPKALPIVR